MLYTIVTDYRGGTYVSQVESDGVDEALTRWAATLKTEDLDTVGPQGKAELIHAIGEHFQLGSGPTPVDGLANVWCKSALVLGELLLINVMLTVKPDAPR